jgi:hypothetical protein
MVPLQGIADGSPGGGHVLRPQGEEEEDFIYMGAEFRERSKPSAKLSNGQEEASSNTATLAA